MRREDISLLLSICSMLSHHPNDLILINDVENKEVAYGQSRVAAHKILAALLKYLLVSDSGCMTGNR